VIYVDLDDFHAENTSIELLEELKREIPQFRVTLFAIPRRCPRPFVTRILEEDWIDLVPHGWDHRTSRECEHWGFRDMSECLKRCQEIGFTTRGFKAPGWQISNGCYETLRLRGYWVADQEYNNHRRPADLPVYLLDSPDKIHGHIGGTMDNELSRIMPEILKHRDEEFGFVRDALRRPQISRSPQPRPYPCFLQ
jgi:hypothetical protein